MDQRKHIRLTEYDYSQNGYYFVTICTKDRKNVLWESVGATCGRPHLSTYGKVVEEEISKFDNVYTGVRIDKYVVMPNHIHMIIAVEADDGRPQVAPTLSRMIQQFKGSVSKKAGVALWQKSFYDHIIRNDADYLAVWQYIETNPVKWELDKYYTD